MFGDAFGEADEEVEGGNERGRLGPEADDEQDAGDRLYNGGNPRVYGRRSDGSGEEVAVFIPECPIRPKDEDGAERYADDERGQLLI